MKKVVTAILISSYLLGVAQFTMPFLSYYANYTYFAKVACINKDHPEVHCNGKCQLKKMIEHEHHPDSSAPDNATQIEKTPSSTIFFFKESENCIFASVLYTHFKNAVQLLSTQCIADLPSPPPKFG